jgi:hypothetical protein
MTPFEIRQLFRRQQKNDPQNIRYYLLGRALIRGWNHERVESRVRLQKLPDAVYLHNLLEEFLPQDVLPSIEDCIAFCTIPDERIVTFPRPRRTKIWSDAEREDREKRLAQLQLTTQAAWEEICKKRNLRAAKKAAKKPPQEAA